MSTRSKNPFSTVTSSGMLLPLDLLVRIADGDANLPGLTPDAYHLRSGERLNEAASRARTQCKAAWDSFRRKLAALPASDTGTTLTRNEWLLPLFQELDYGRLQPKPAIVIDEKTYPVSHRWEEHVPIHLLSAKIPLDKRTAGVDGAATRSPYSMVQELLNRSGKFRWGMVSNGLKLYLLRDNNSLSRAANVEFDLEAMMDGEVYADFMLLWLLCHQSRVEILSTGVGSQATRENSESQGAGKKGNAKGKASGKTAKSASRKTGKLLIEEDYPESSDVDSESDLDELDESDAVELPETSSRPDPSSCWLERWTKEAESRGTRAREKLRSGVENAINALGAGFLETRGNEQLKQRLTTGTLDKQDYYRQLLRMVYRLLLLLVAEEKKDENGQNLLHPLGTPESVRQRYAKFYSVGRLRDLAGLRRGTSHTDLFESLKVLFEKLREGYEPLGIPGLGSFLFSTTATPDLDNAHLSNVAILECFRHLSYTDDVSKSRRVVDFGNLGSEELGSVYESLLELHPKINTDKGPFILDSAAGSERKTTGSYYTPTSLINCLLDSALDPVVNDAINVNDATEAERRLLNLKVCDPACGSGHFLIAAAERLAVHLARLRTGDDQPPTMVVQHAKRDIIGRCIYGVDLNPMAVELCKVSLWMEALDPGRPLSFLDHHIQCGNSLLGTTPALLKEGIPDDAFNPIEGDVKTVCAELKRQNKRERQDRERGQGLFEFEPYIKLGNLPSEFSRLSSSSDDSVTDLAAKERRYAELVKDANYLNARLLADLWCAVFVWKKNISDLGKLCPTENDFRKIENNPHSTLPHVKSEVRHLADQYQFFHWHLAFPDVFQLPEVADRAENERTGWSRGFDVVLGNPPWERLKVSDIEFFSRTRPDIADISNAAKRRKAIEELSESEKELSDLWSEELRIGAGKASFVKFSNVFPLTGLGELNTFALFAEVNRSLISQCGRAGFIIQSDIATGKTYRHFFADLLETGQLRSFYDFVNTEGLFPNIHRTHPHFCLITLSGTSDHRESDFAFWNSNVGHLAEVDRHFTLSADDLRTVNPNTLNCPIFHSSDDAALCLFIYRSLSVLDRDDGEDSGWKPRVTFVFEMNKHSHLFKSAGELIQPGEAVDIQHQIVDANGDQWVSLYEAKQIHQFDHRYATFGVAGDKVDSRDCTIPEHQLAEFVPQPQQLVKLVDFRSVTEKREIRDAWLLTYRDITNSSNVRTSIFSALPYVPMGNTWTLIMPDVGAVEATCFLANMNSFPSDYISRRKIGGAHLNYYILRQLPVVSRSGYQVECGWGSTELAQWIMPRVLELTYTAWDLEAFALDCRYDGPPFRWDEERRFLLRCELDAAYFHLYLGASEEWGNDNPQLREMFPTPRHAVEYIMETFPIVKRKDIKRTTIIDENGQVTQPGTYITKDTILSIYDAMTDSIRTGVPYQTRLDPPPGPPTDADGHIIPFAEWTTEIRDRYADVIHPPRDRRATPRQLRRDRGEKILILRLLLAKARSAVQVQALELMLLFALNDGLRQRVAEKRSATQPAEAQPSSFRWLPGLQGHLNALQGKSVVAIEKRNDSKFVTLLNDSGLDGAIAKSLAPIIDQAISAFEVIKTKREADAADRELTELEQQKLLIDFVEEGELETLDTL